MTEVLTPVSQSPGPLGPRPNSIELSATVGALAVSTVLIAFDLQVPLLRVLCGLYVLIILPLQLVRAKIDWSQSSRTEATIYSLCLVLLAAMAGGLLINEALPLVGIRRPLDRLPLLVWQLCLIGGLATWRPKRWSWRGGPPPEDTLRGMTGCELVVGVAALAIVAGSAAGAIRLNNGGSGVVTGVMLVAATCVIGCILVKRSNLRELVIKWALYCLSLAMLLMTSLRGWYITGHDIHREYHVYGLTAANGNWDISRFRDPYNSCMSITILPTSFVRLTAIPDFYVFKLLIPLAFAACPVIIYLLARRFATHTVALLSAVYFLSFPTYFTDMPFMCRQQVAYLFLGAAFLVIANHDLSLRRRQVWFGIFSAGVVLSHYSTTYVLIGVLGIGWAAARVTAVIQHIRKRPPPNGRWLKQDQAPVLGIANIAVLVAMTMIWTGPATHTGGHLESTIAKVSLALVDNNGVRSSDVTYNLFSTFKPNPSEQLANYSNETRDQTAVGRQAGDYYPLSVIDQFPTPVAQSAQLPLTQAGQLLHDAGVNVSGFNYIVRQSAAKLLQIFVILGLVAVALRRNAGLHVTREQYFLAIGSFAIVLSQVVLPTVSVEYGLLRAFQQSLFILAPFLAAGSFFLFKWASNRIAISAAGGISVLFFLSLTGLIPQFLGGYPAQLHLNNSGDYYDVYYLHPEEKGAIEWLQDRLSDNERKHVQSEVATDRYTFSRVREYSGIQTADDIFPMLLRREAYVFLGFSTVTKDQATVFHAGEVITYRYPVAFLDKTKNKIYSNGGADIYR